MYFSGSTSGIPPTLELTTVSPQATATKIAIQNASLKKMSPQINNLSLTLEWHSSPSIWTLDCKPYFSMVSSKTILFGPSPPITKSTVMPLTFFLQRQ